MLGRISKLFDQGYGFIETENGESIFLHASNLQGGYPEFETLRVGAELEFEVGEGKGGKPQAINIKVSGSSDNSDEG